MGNFVVRSPGTNLYALEWITAATGAVRVEWVKKSNASTYHNRAEAAQVFKLFPNSVMERR